MGKFSYEILILDMLCIKYPEYKNNPPNVFGYYSG